MTGSSATTAKAIRLRRLLDGPELVRAVGAHNGLTALLAARAGFEAIWASGFEISASHALPDASLLSMTQLLDAAEAMDMACPVPVIADCDTGFGGPRNVEHTVLSYERRGIAGICIEDKMFPKLNSFAAVAHDLVPVPDFVAKVKAGKAAQKSEDFILIARTEALVAGLDLEEAVNRARAYAEAGADAVLVHSKSREPLQILEFGEKWDLDTPLVAVPTTYDGVYEHELKAAGFRLVIYANHAIRAAIRGINSALAVLSHAGRSREVAEQIVPMSEVFGLQGMTAAFETDQ